MNTKESKTIQFNVKENDCKSFVSAIDGICEIIKSSISKDVIYYDCNEKNYAIIMPDAKAILHVQVYKNYIRIFDNVLTKTKGFLQLSHGKIYEVQEIIDRLREMVYNLFNFKSDKIYVDYNNFTSVINQVEENLYELSEENKVYVYSYVDDTDGERCADVINCSGRTYDDKKKEVYKKKVGELMYAILSLGDYESKL